MKNIIKFVIALFGLLPATMQIAWAQQEIDKTAVEVEVKKLFQNYEYYGSLVESFNDDKVSETVIGQFKNLFDPAAMVYNDIKQSENYDKKVSLLSYVNELKNWYPSGLSVSLSPPELGTITCNKGNCRVTVPVSKSMGGLTKLGADFRNENIIENFVVGFDEGLKTFKILEIKGSQEDVAEVPVETKPDKKPKKADSVPTAKEDKVEASKTKPQKDKQSKVKKIKPNTENVFAKGNNEKAKRSVFGLHVGFGWSWLGSVADFSPLGGGSSEALSDADALFSENFGLGNRPLSYKSVLGLNRVGLTYQKYFGEHVGFTAGIDLQNCRSVIGGDIVDQDYEVPISQVGSNEPDNTLFSRSFEALKFEENYSFSAINMSLGVQYQWYSYIRKNRFRPYVKMGVDFAVSSFAHSVEFKGNITSTSSYTQNGTGTNDDIQYILEYDINIENAYKIYNDIYWLYDDNAVVSGRKPNQALIAKASSFNISPNAEVGFDWVLDKNGHWSASVAARLSVGMLPLFATRDKTIYGSNSTGVILLKRHNTGTDDNLDTYYDYSPIEENRYEYRSIHGADVNTTPHFMEFLVGVKYIIQKSKK